MKQNKTKWILTMFLIVVMAAGLTACSKKDDAAVSFSTEVYEDGTILGEGETQFALKVIHKNGDEVNLEIHTNESTVGKALMELGVLDGEEGDYGLYIKTVNGETVDFDADGKYWAFYVNDEYALTGVDQTEIVAGDSYTLKVE